MFGFWLANLGHRVSKMAKQWPDLFLFKISPNESREPLIEWVYQIEFLDHQVSRLNLVKNSGLNTSFPYKTLTFNLKYRSWYTNLKNSCTAVTPLYTAVKITFSGTAHNTVPHFYLCAVRFSVLVCMVFVFCVLCIIVYLIFSGLFSLCTRLFLK